MRKSGEITSWVVYKMTVHGRPDQMNAICGRAEWDAMELSRPGYHTLIQADIPNEATAEKIARGTSGDAKERKSSFSFGTYAPPISS